MLRVSFRSFAIAVSLISLTIGLSRGAAADDADAKIKPVRALLVLGGCCHDYKAQMDLLAKGISERAHVEVVIALDKDTSTAHLNPVYENANWAEGFDVIIHDECSSDVKDLAIIDRILEPSSGFAGRAAALRDAQLSQRRLPEAGDSLVRIHRPAIHRPRASTADQYQLCGSRSSGDRRPDGLDDRQ